MHGNTKYVDMSDKKFLSYLTGIVFGDGHATDSFISIAYDNTDDDMEYLYTIQTEIENKLDINTAINWGTTGHPNLVVSSVILGRYFTKMKYPLWDMSDIEYPEEFVSGIIDTDGSIVLTDSRGTSRCINITQAEKDSIDKICNMLNTLSISPICVSHTTRILKKTGIVGSKLKKDSYEQYLIRIQHSRAILTAYDILKLRNRRKNDRLTIIAQDAEAANEKNIKIDKIVEALEGATDGLTVAEISSITNIDIPQVRATLWYHEKKGEIKSYKNGSRRIYTV